MDLLAQISLHPGGVLAWIIAGLIAGWLAGLAMRGSGYGFVGDIFLGLVGALVGGFLTSFLIEGETGFWGSILIAFLGAVVLVAFFRLISGRGAMRPM